MYNLYFEDRFGESRLVKRDIGTNDEDIYNAIKAYVTELNPKYRIYYTRSWCKDNVRWYDVGSHTEFFKLVEE